MNTYNLKNIVLLLLNVQAQFVLGKRYQVPSKFCSLSSYSEFSIVYLIQNFEWIYFLKALQYFLECMNRSGFGIFIIQI